PDKNQLSAARASAEGFRYDRVQRSRQTEQLIAAFPIAPKAIEAQTRPTPIFIVGMPRSGTTLVESILGAHSKVFACGERQAMRGVMQEFTALETGISAIAAATRRRWRESYVRELPALGGATAITEKNPWNFDALGMIFELFPDARVIHVRRDPVETGLSIFRNEFPQFASFATRLRHRPLLRRVRAADVALGVRPPGSIHYSPVRGSGGRLRRCRAAARRVLRSGVGGGMQEFLLHESDHRHDERSPGPKASKCFSWARQSLRCLCVSAHRCTPRRRRRHPIRSRRGHAVATYNTLH